MDKDIDEALEGLKTSIDENVNSKLGEMQSQLDTLSTRAKDIPMSGRSQSELMVNLQNNAGNFKNFAENKIPFRMKAATTIDTSSLGTGVVQGLREQGVNEAPFRKRIINIISSLQGGPGSNPLTWIEWRPKDGGPDSVSESATKPQMDWTYQQGTANAEVIAVTAVTTKQALLNMTILAEQIRSELLNNLADELDYQILHGSGASPDLKGIDQYAKAFTGADLAGELASPNNFDVVRAAILQVRQGNRATTGYSRRTGYIASHILMNPADVAAMDTVKDENGQYLKPFWANGQRISGVEIVESDFLDAGDFIIGDFSKSLFNFVEGIMLETGLVNDQFIKNQLTIRAEVYGAHRIKYHDAWAFVKGDFESAKALLAQTT